MADGHHLISGQEHEHEQERGDAAGIAPGPLRDRYARRWAMRGAVAGLVIAIFNVLALGVGSWHPAALAGCSAAAVLAAALIGFAAGVIADGTRLDETARPDDGASRKRRRNFFARFWRGEVRLWISFWIVGLAVGIALVFVAPLMVVLSDAESGHRPVNIFIASALTWTCVATLSVWESVGLWRSAGRYMQQRVRTGRKPFWGVVAQVWVVLGVAGGAVAAVGEAGPQLIENYRVAFQNDPDTPDYAIRVMREGTEAVIVGGFKFGLTDDFTKVLDAAGGIKVVHLDSVGGRLREAKRLYDLIRDRGLLTYVSSECFSACALAFAAGRERYLKQGASLGFHRAYFPGIDETEFDGALESIFRQAGIDKDFIARALSTPHSDMWTPDVDILLKAKVVSKVVNGNEFALSGDEIFRQRLSEELVQAMPLLQALKEEFPGRYDALVDEYHQAVVKGRGRPEAWAALRSHLMSFLSSLAPRADDEVVVEYGRLTIEQYAALSARNPDGCHAFSIKKPADIFADQFPDALNAREAILHHRTLRTARPRDKADEAETSALWVKLWDRLQGRGITEADLALMNRTDVAAEQRGHRCASVITFFEEVVALPVHEAAILMRTLLAQQ